MSEQSIFADGKPVVVGPFYQANGASLSDEAPISLDEIRVEQLLVRVIGTYEGRAWLNLTTPRERLELRTTPTGLIRIYDRKRRCHWKLDDMEGGE